LLVELARGLVRNHEVPAELYARAEAELGTQQLVEAVTLTGLYGMIGLVIKAFDVPPAADDPPTF
jgi:alkylhydroperoxidase family enzyme